MRSFMSPSSSPAGRPRLPVRSWLPFRHAQTGAVGLVNAGPADAEAALRALLCRSEAFAEDLGPNYAGMRFTPGIAAVAGR